MPTRIRRRLVSAALIAIPIVLIVIVLDVGVNYHHSQGAVAQPAAGSADAYSRLLIALPVILAACYLAGMLFRRMRQPQ